MSKQKTSRTGAMRRGAVRAFAIGAAALTAVAVAAPAQAEEIEGGPLECGVQFSTVTVYSYETAGDWEHTIVSEDGEVYTESGTLTSPDFVRTISPFRTASNWSVEADDFGEAGAMCYWDGKGEG
ncbi:hypothetical protein GCM10029992_12970 [Glycomyces albus]